MSSRKLPVICLTKSKTKSMRDCLSCNKVIPLDEEANLCKECINKGWWIDPAGGVHPPEEENDFYDAAAMYE